MFLKNEWYVACRADEITDKPLGRKICNEAMVFFRGPDNAVAAVQDFWKPLSVMAGVFSFVEMANSDKQITNS